MIGDISVGKTNLLTRFTTNEFTHKLNTTIGVDFAMKKIIIGDKVIEAQIWDSAGQTRYRSIVKFYFRGTHGILLVYDVTNRESFNHIEQWLSEIKDLPSMTNIILLVGNKSDLKYNREVSTQEGTIFAHKNKLSFIETSALNGSNVNDAFISIISQIHTHHHTHPHNNIINKQHNNSVSLSSTLTIINESDTKNQCLC